MTSVEDNAENLPTTSDQLNDDQNEHLEDQNSTQSDFYPDSYASDPPQKRHIEKSFFFSVEDVQYNRDVSPMVPFPNGTSERSSPAHILTVTGAKGAWTQSNRDMAFSLYDSW